MSEQLYKVEIPDSVDLDSLGYPTEIRVGKVGSHVGFRDYRPRDIAFLNEVSGKLMCSCCGRQLKRDYLVSRRWRFCPTCGAEIMGRLGE
jgi:hypothetical protein